MLSGEELKFGKRLKKQEFTMLLKLFYVQPWLSTREESVLELLEHCHELDEQILICELLHRFQYLTSSESKIYLGKMVDHITGAWGLSPEETQVVATTPDEDPDSAQQILQMLKPEFAERMWHHAKLLNRIGNSVKFIAERPNVVLVDEFVGTGKTMAKRIRDIRPSYDDHLRRLKAKRNYGIKVCVLGSMLDAHEVVTAAGVEMFSALWLKKGISGYLIGDELEVAKNRMLRLESELMPNVEGVELPSFGYGKAEALYSMEGGNTPNSVFPIFWWPYLVSGRRRITILKRLERNSS
jgi:hypothetical protein